MKNTTMRKLAGIAAIVTLASCMMAPMGMTAFANEEETPVTTYTITVNNDVADHTYEAYQIFKGDLSGTTLSNIDWGAGVDATTTVNNKTLLEAVKAITLEDGTTPFATCTDASTVAEKLGEDATADNETAFAFANVVADYLKTASKTTNVHADSDDEDDVADHYALSGLEAGYYLVKDQDSTLNGKNDAYTAFILKVVADTSADVKSALPTVDKQVLDETADAEAGAAEGWGETADHSMYESFDFKLIAKLPSDNYLAEYETYQVVFQDTMANGVVYEGIDSVTVNGAVINEKGEGVTDGYAVETIENAEGTTSLTITVSDLVTLCGEDGISEAEIVVIYSAHLDDEAQYNTIGGDNTTTTNKNTVYLEYSNNPNWDGDGDEELGKTEPDTVWVFTYDMNNSKIDGDTQEALEGAGFALLDSTGTAVSLIYDEDLEAYRPVTTGETAVEYMESTKNEAGDAVFNIVGLDAGTYTLTEKKIPDGYNKCADVKVVISATHIEDADGVATTTLSMTVDGAVANEVVIENKAGSSLPSTGGIGTTLFYVIGGTMAAGAGVYLISKKRMNKED